MITKEKNEIKCQDVEKLIEIVIINDKKIISCYNNGKVQALLIHKHIYHIPFWT